MEEEKDEIFKHYQLKKLINKHYKVLINIYFHIIIKRKINCTSQKMNYLQLIYMKVKLCDEPLNEITN